MAKAKKKTSEKPREKLVLQKRKEDTIVYVRMKAAMYDEFEEAYAAHVADKLLNTASFGMSSFVRGLAFQQLREDATAAWEKQRKQRKKRG